MRFLLHLRAGERRAGAARVEEPAQRLVDHLKLRVGQGLTGWVAEHRQPVAVGCHAFEDPRFQVFNELPEDNYEAFLSVPCCAADGWSR